MKDKKNRCKGC